MAPHAPQAKKIPTTRSFHGHDYVDNYEWLRDMADPDVRAHIEAENVWTAQHTEHLAAFREQLVTEYASLTQLADISAPARVGEWWYVTRTWEDRDYPACYRFRSENRPAQEDVPALAQAGQLVWDGNLLARGKEFFSTSNFLPSPDGKKAALGVDYAGDEHFRIRVWEIESGAIVDEVVSGAGYGLAWLADSSGFVYTRVNEAWRTNQVFLHRLGQMEDELLFEEHDEQFELSVGPSRCGNWVIVTSVARDCTEVHLFSAASPQESFVVCPRQAGLEYFVEPAGDHLLITHNLHTPDGEVAAAPVGTSVPSQWMSIRKAADGERINEVEAFATFAVVSMRRGGLPALAVMTREAVSADQARGVAAAALKAPATAREEGGEPSPTLATAEAANSWGEWTFIEGEGAESVEAAPGAGWEDTSFYYGCEGYVAPGVVYCYTPAGADGTAEPRTELVKRVELPAFNAEEFRTKRVWVPARDGVRVPMDLLYRADLTPDGTHPGLIWGYGSYEVSIDPSFVPRFVAMARRGMVVAVAHPRGGGEMGRQWYEAARKETKPRTFDDFIDCSRWLISEGWVDAHRLAAEGGSAGGMLMGAIANRAPELYRAIHAAVPFVDVLTTMLKPELPLTAGEWEEWGNPLADPKAYEVIASYTPTENIRAVEYPAILATTSLNDVRVSYVEPTKWIQLLRATVTNGEDRPILQQTEIVAGHAGKSGRSGRWERNAFSDSWLMSQVGVNA